VYEAAELYEFDEAHEAGEVNEANEVNDVEHWREGHEAWGGAEFVEDRGAFEPAAEYVEYVTGFEADAEHAEYAEYAEYAEHAEHVADFEADATGDAGQHPVGFGASEAPEIVEALKAAEVPQTPVAAVPQTPIVAVPETPVAMPAAPAVPESVGGRSRGKAGRVVDRRLGRLRRDGWAVLAPSGKQSGAEFDRLVIGPPGVFAITLRHAGAGGMPPNPALTPSAAATAAPAPAPAPSTPATSGIPGVFGGGPRDADFAARMLSAASGMAVKVTPMLAFVGVGASAVTAYPPPGRRAEDPGGGVLIARGEDVADVLWGLPSVYSPQERRQISDSARRADLWRPV
jgi:hypothetical protein